MSFVNIGAGVVGLECFHGIIHGSQGEVGGIRSTKSSVAVRCSSAATAWGLQLLQWFGAEKKLVSIEIKYPIVSPNSLPNEIIINCPLLLLELPVGEHPIFRHPNLKQDTRMVCLLYHVTV